MPHDIDPREAFDECDWAEYEAWYDGVLEREEIARVNAELQTVVG